jgi:hypothetical protein
MSSAYRSIKAWVVDTFEPLRPVYDAWMKIIAAFSWVSVRVALVALFITMFLIYGLVLRVIRKDPMNRQLGADRESYWGDNIVDNTTLDDFKKMY